MSEFVDIEWCEWCVADSGRTHATRPCCIARRVSKMTPAGRRNALVASGGAADALRAAALRSMAMRMAKMVKEQRLDAYRRALRDGWLPQDIEVLKRAAREEFERGQADGC